jgi:hypothetical protein
MGTNQNPGAEGSARGAEVDQLCKTVNPANTRSPGRLQIHAAAPRGRAGNLARCAACGAALAPRRGSRRQKFCCYGCRDEARRARNHAKFSVTRYRSQGKPRSVQNRPLSSKDCEGVFADRPRRVNAVPRAVIEREIYGGAEWFTVTSPDGVTCKVLPARIAGRSP